MAEGFHGYKSYDDWYDRGPGSVAFGCRCRDSMREAGEDSRRREAEAKQKREEAEQKAEIKMKRREQRRKRVLKNLREELTRTRKQVEELAAELETEKEER